MDSELKHERAIRQYLLGELSGTELEEVEEKMLADSAYLDQVSVWEDDLINNYVCGLLSKQDQERFEKKFFQTREGCEQVKLANALRKYALGSSTTRQEPLYQSAERSSFKPSIFDLLISPVPVRRYVLAALALMLILGGAWVTVEIRQMQNRVNQIRDEQGTHNGYEQGLKQQLAAQQALNQQLSDELQFQQEQQTKLQQELAALKNAKSGAKATALPLSRALATVFLLPGSDRSPGERKKLIIGPNVESVPLQLSLKGGGYENYRAALVTSEDKEIWSASLLKPRKLASTRNVNVVLQADSLSSGDYFVKLSGITADETLEDVGKYYFKVVRK